MVLGEGVHTCVWLASVASVPVVASWRLLRQSPDAPTTGTMRRHFLILTGSIISTIWNSLGEYVENFNTLITDKWLSPTQDRYVLSLRSYNED